MHIGANTPAAHAFENAERFGIEGVGTADYAVQDVGDIGF
jgi:hypothetical protein